jgi:hypothetical protein
LVYLIEVKKKNKDNSVGILGMYRWRGSNPHSLARNGF